MNKSIATKEDWEVGKWLSAALDDKMVCQEMKDDINKWMESKEWPEEETETKSTNQLNIEWEKINPERKENE